MNSLKNTINDVIYCKICGSPCKLVSSHLRVHHMSKDEYLKLYPGADLISNSLRDKKSSDMTRRNNENWKDEVYRNKKSESTRRQWEDKEFRSYMSTKCSESLKKRWKEDEGFRELRSKSSSKTMKALWKNTEFIKGVPDKCKRTTKRLWSDPTYREIMSKKFKDAWTKERKEKRLMCEALGIYKPRHRDHTHISSIHQKVCNRLDTLGINYEVEKLIGRLYVDIYLPDTKKVIEVNGEYWHGKHDIPISNMTDIQVDGYTRDMKRKEMFGSNILFLWESEILNESYKEILNIFLGIEEG